LTSAWQSRPSWQRRISRTSYFYLSTTAPRVLLFAGVLRAGSITRCGAVKVLAGVTRAAAGKRFGYEIVYSALLRGDTPRYQVVSGVRPGSLICSCRDQTPGSTAGCTVYRLCVSPQWSGWLCSAADRKPKRDRTWGELATWPQGQGVPNTHFRM
jgi:hypothetical protein